MAYFPKQAVERLAALFPEAVFYKPTQARVIALTIDDIPTPGNTGGCSTRWILDAIADHNQSVSNLAEKAQATFFAIGSHLNGDTTLLADLVAQGHELGNHGWVDTWTVLQSERCFQESVISTHERLQVQVPHHPIRWYRPGRAFYSPAMGRVLKRLSAYGYQPYFALASMLPLDTLPLTANPAFTVQYLTQQLFPGAILLLHGGSPERAQNTATTLRLLLPVLRSRGYRIMTLSQLWEGSESAIISTPTAAGTDLNRLPGESLIPEWNQTTRAIMINAHHSSERCQDGN